MTEYALVLNTCPDVATGKALAKALVEKNLAACVNVMDNIHSIYRWQGKIIQDSEALLLIKTVEKNVSAIQRYIVEHHPYELPEVVSVPMNQGHPLYLQWIADNTQQQEPLQ